MLKIFLYALLIIIAAIAISHIFLPVLGGIIIFSATAWVVLIATIVLFCGGILSIFVLSGIGALLLVFFLGGWVIVALIFFPLLLPIILPLLILFLFIRFMIQRYKHSAEKEKDTYDHKN